MKKIALAAMILGMAGVLGACSMDGHSHKFPHSLPAASYDIHL